VKLKDVLTIATGAAIGFLTVELIKYYLMPRIERSWL